MPDIPLKECVYHFYCAVNEHDQRGIAVAVSEPKGRSKLRFPEPEPTGKRGIVQLNEDWYTVAAEENSRKYDAFDVNGDWKRVNIPHNWDDYHGYRQHLHGNRHGNAWYKKEFRLPEYDGDKRFFIRFEGVGTYATVTLNGKNFGRHPGGRTTFTLDVTDAVNRGGNNVLTVKAEHPSMITDMPWVCGRLLLRVGLLGRLATHGNISSGGDGGGRQGQNRAIRCSYLEQ